MSARVGASTKKWCSSSTLSDIDDLDVVQHSPDDLETIPDVMSIEDAIASFATFDNALYIDLDLADEIDAALLE